MMQNNQETFNKLAWSSYKEDFKKRLGEYPSVISSLFIIGLEQLSTVSLNELTKEQKQDVIHVGLCHLLEKEGIYKFLKKDDDGWPHYEQTKKTAKIQIEKQENYLRSLILKYYNYEK